MEMFLQQNYHEQSISVNKHILESLPYNDTVIRKVVLKLKEQKLYSLKENTLGVLFEELIREEERKDLGQFYTPQEIVDYMINFLNIDEKSKILDPTCGCGVFLTRVYTHLKQRSNSAIDNLYGVDLNESATKITRINIWLRNGKDSKSLKTLEKNIRVGNSIISNDKLDNKAFNWDKEFPQILIDGGFDLIIGNPPYLTLKENVDYDITEPFFSEISNGTANAASLIIARSFQLLKENGIMAFVLPKTILRVNSYSKLRTFLLHNSKILHIFDLGNYFEGVRGEQLILFIQKTNNKTEIKKNKILIKSFTQNKGLSFNQKGFYILQSVFNNYDNFLIFDNKKLYALIDKISGTKLETISDIFRGVPISPSSSSIKTSGEGIPIIKGNNIHKFSCNPKYFINVSKNSISPAKIAKLKKEKIILQNIFSSEAGLISCIDKWGYLNFDTVTNIVLKDRKFDIRYVFGLLNSKLINFYLIYSVYNQSKLTMHTDKTYIGKIPIKDISLSNQKEVIKIVNKIMDVKNRNYLLNELDRIVYKLYNINSNERNLIEEYLRKSLSKKSIW